jgi:hypothetical protein
MAELTPVTDEEINRTSAVVGSSLVFVAVRCTLQYIVLPFILPILGLSNLVSIGLSIGIETFALGMIAYNVVRLWNTSWRWGYLLWSSLVVFIIGVFLYMDIRALTL